MTRARARLLVLALGGAACTDAEPPTGVETTAGSSEAEAATTTSTASGSGEAGSTGPVATTDGGSTGTAPSDESTAGDTADATDSGGMPPAPKSCALAVIDPEADPAAVIDAGDGATQIPTGVGEALLRNCGCHYTDDVPIGLYVDYSSNAQPLATLADFHGAFTGTFPMGFEGMPAYLAVERRVVDHDPLPMPPYGCGVEGEPGMISAADLQLLGDWLAAGAPDGASFP